MNETKPLHPLAAFRSERGISQVELAKMLGVDSMTVSRWERGVLAPRRKLWPKIIAVTGVTPSQMVAAVTEAAE